MGQTVTKLTQASSRELEVRNPGETLWEVREGRTCSDLVQTCSDCGEAVLVRSYRVGSGWPSFRRQAEGVGPRVRMSPDKSFVSSCLVQDRGSMSKCRTPREWRLHEDLFGNPEGFRCCSLDSVRQSSSPAMFDISCCFSLQCNAKASLAGSAVRCVRTTARR